MLSKIEEISLITRCVAADDRRAFEKLVNEHSPAVRNFLFRLTTGNAALTDDLAQETFIKAYLGLRSFKAVARFRTWLFSIAYHEFVSHSRRLREMAVPDNYELNSLADTATDSDSRIAEMRHDVQVALSALSDSERTVTVLFYLNDLPIKDICRITSMPEGTVKSHLSRAKAKMTKMITD